MDFNLDATAAGLEEFQAEVRAWLDAAMQKGTHFRWSASWSTRNNSEEYSFRRDFARQLGEKGWLFPTYAQEYGGAGLSAEHRIVIERELDRYELRLEHLFYTLARIVAPCILHWGTEEQKLEFLPPLTRAEVSTWQVLTEPQGGSDIATCRTIALRDGDAYIVNGQKTMVGWKGKPDFLWTLVCTDPGGARHENLSWIYIPADLPGITIQPMSMMMGIKNSIFFDDVRVPAKYLVGGENNGWRVSATHLELEHGGSGGITGDSPIDRLIEVCTQPRADGTRLVDDRDVRDLLAECIIASHSTQIMAVRNYWHRQAHIPHGYGGAQFRYYNRIVRLENAKRAQQILGSAALVQDLNQHEVSDLEHLARSGPGQLHGGGTLDTDRLVMARRLGLGARARESAPVTV